MKKMILMTILVSVISSLGYCAIEFKSIGGVQYRLEDHSAIIIGASPYSPYLEAQPTIIRINEGVPNDTLPVTAVENPYQEWRTDTYSLGLSGLMASAIKLPESVKEIRYLSMFRNRYLTSVEMPGVETIEKEAMKNNPAISEPLVLKNLVYLGERAFDGCTNLPEIHFGSKLRHVAKDAFKGCDNLKVIDIGNPDTWSRVIFEIIENNPIRLTKNFKVNGSEAHNLDIDARWSGILGHAFYSAENIRRVRVRNAIYIGESAFDKCVNITDVCLDVDSLGDLAFGNTPLMKRLYVMRENPPIVDKLTFWNFNATLYVPKGCIDTYRNSDSCWRFFLNIEESDFSEVDDIFRADYDVTDPSSVDSIEGEEREEDNAIDPTQPLEVYTMQGQLISRSMDGLQPGLYILRQDRKAKKVLIGHQ